MSSTHDETGARSKSHLRAVLNDAQQHDGDLDQPARLSVSFHTAFSVETSALPLSATRFLKIIIAGSVLRVSVNLSESPSISPTLPFSHVPRASHEGAASQP